MWIWQRDYVKLLTDSNENKVRAEFTASELKAVTESHRKILQAYRNAVGEIKELKARVAELEKGLLAKEDEVNQLKRVQPPAFNLTEMFEQEDEAEVAKLRKRILENGADVVLSEAILSMEK